MEQTPRFSEYGDGEELQQEGDNICQENTIMAPDIPENLILNTQRGWESFPCQDCESCFTNKQSLERHMHSHALMNVPHPYKTKIGKMASGSALGQLHHDNMNSSVLVRSDEQLESSDTPVLSAGHNTVPPDELLCDHHVCNYCEKRFTTFTNKEQHESTVHRQHLQIAHAEQSEPPQEENLQQIIFATSNPGVESAVEVVENEVELTGNFMPDFSSSISENLSIYFDGKLVSTSTVSGCEAAEVHAACSTLVGLDALILDPIHLNLGLNFNSVPSNQELPGQTLAKRRTATPPLLPQIQTELESEVAVLSSSSENVSSLIENSQSSLLPPNSATLFIREKQDTLVPDGQTPCSSVSAATGRFKRRTGSPQSSPQHNTTCDEETAMADLDGDAATLWHMDPQYNSLVHQGVNEKEIAFQKMEDPQAITVSVESWPPVTVDSCCSQQPLDLSNTMKLNEVGISDDAALDLSLQKRSREESHLTPTLVFPSEDNLNVCMQDTALLNVTEQNVNLANCETPLVSDLTIVTSQNMVDSVPEGIVYGLSLPSCPLNSASATLTPLGFSPGSPCNISFPPPTTHPVLQTAPSLITVLAPPLSIPNPSSQPIQVVAPNISPEPVVLCTENAINSTQCDLTTGFSATTAANLVTLSHPLDPSLNLPGHMFLTDQISLNPSINEDHSLSEVAFAPSAALNNPLINSYMTSNTVVIECTISLETPGNVPTAVTMQENIESPISAPMLVNDIEQEQTMSLPNTSTVDPTIVLSSIEESVTLSTSTSVMPDCDCPAEAEETEQGLKEEPQNADEDLPDSANSAVEISTDNSNQDEKVEQTELPSDTPCDAEQQSFTKNFICNVCELLFHSMKELSTHVSDHAEKWPYKCEFCVLLFDKPNTLLDHRSSLHGVDKTYICSACSKDFVYLCNLKQHQEELHPTQQCTFTEEEKGKIRPQNYNSTTKVSRELPLHDVSEQKVKKEESEVDVAAEELFTTIKIMASDGGKLKVPDVRLGINQHYPSFKPPPFPYHNRSPAGSLASATNFTTHNIPQTFSTAIRCTKCGKSFNNMPELHKHILACANASDKRRYTPKKNPIPLRHFAKTQNGVLSTTNSENECNASNRARRSNRSESSVKVKLKLLNKRKRKLVQRVMPQRNKSSSHKVSPAHMHDDLFVCPHCSREFTMRRSRTKHMAVCPKKPREVRTRKDGGISVTKENDGRLHREVSLVIEQQASAHPRTRLQTSMPAKRPTTPPTPTSFSNKRPKLAIKDDSKNDISSLNEFPAVRPFNSPLRQYTRVHHAAKLTSAKQQQSEPSAPSREEAAAGGSSGQGGTA
ncbi:PR domain zinc finger protein 2 [Syngnathoides biaculeatus]|uniref:PR domain zinc finger protein 2 n=1 Tax=Syngnathoides biaculeatus TaxID=300417 RepID=UPI002ADD36B1|nr:PR domain zinc finger protein 2 [Syngnathoides biaculeatus]XP_061690859.1 PR domain zinc finger protein 2 [Syngnathoides biaculeatus]XP_061690863.1 PR domain zinc finger protein 2 [Syngnathoides biaculeatus]XP_061690872.1 PR domain zinc finger protein 2 [Syngnathoides biaculeatus]XP_061690878.1 PR domain zinc finger protein 2 [Syngnathoides biaculeatus]